MNKLEQAAREVIRQHSMECLSDKAVDSLREALAEQAEHPVSQEQSYYEGFKCGAETVQLVINIENDFDPEDFENMEKNND